LLNGVEMRIGGYGFPISDEGSGAEIGLQAIRAALRAHDGRLTSTPLAVDLMARFGNDPYAVVAWSERATATDYASFAPRVFQHAEEGDPLAMQIVTNAARQVGRLVQGLKEFGAPRVSLLGGLAVPLSGWLEADIKHVITPAEHDAMAGAVLLARRQAACAQSRETAASDFAGA
jgi:glucosamine kinase